MSRFQKILLASAFVVVGFGVAKFLGQPVLPKPSAYSHSLAQSSVAAVSAPAIAGQGSGIRLLPEAPVSQFGAPAANTQAADLELPRLAGTLAPMADQATNASRNYDFDPTPPTPAGNAASAFGRLRDEAPRVVGIDPQSPATIHRLPPGGLAAQNQNSDPYKVADPKAGSSEWPAPQLLNTGYTESSPAFASTVPASYAVPAHTPSGTLATPPWSAPNQPEPVESRTHIVSDGDSLERLASRYLSDPRRGGEIYELNRDVLSSPDMLPIGVELRIPDRVLTSLADPRGFQPNTASVQPIGNVVSEKTMSANAANTSSVNIIPRAQLAPPMMVQ